MAQVSATRITAELPVTIACTVVSSFYGGHLYRLVNLPLALVSCIVFSVWPTGGRAIYGWFFALF